MRDIMETGVIALVLLLTFSASQGQQCSPPDDVSTKQVMTYAPASLDYFYIGGLFEVHDDGGSTDLSCDGRILNSDFQNLEAFFWAIKTAQTRYRNILSDTDIRGFAMDSCGSVYNLAQQVTNLETCSKAFGDPKIIPRRTLAYLGPSSDSSQTYTISPLFYNLQKPLIGYSATSPSLSNEKEFPNFLRTIPSDDRQYIATAQIIQKMDFDYIQVVHDDDDFGKNARDSFKKEAENQGINIAQILELQIDGLERDFNNVVDDLSSLESTRAVVVLSTRSTIRRLLKAVKTRGRAGMFTWIGTADWADRNDVINGYEKEAEGAITLALSPSSSAADDFINYFRQLRPETYTDNPWFNEYWEQTFQCNLPSSNPGTYSRSCSSSDTLESVPSSVYIPYVIQAVDAVVHAVDRLQTDYCAGGGICSQLYNQDILRAIKDVTIGGRKVFGSSGDPVTASYFVYNLRQPDDECQGSHCYIKVGETSNNNLVMDKDIVYVYDTSAQRIADPLSICPSCVLTKTTTTRPTTTSQVGQVTTECNPPSPPGGLRPGAWPIVIIILASIGIVLVIVFEIYLIYRITQTSTAHWKTLWLGQTLLFGIFLCYLLCFVFVPVPTRSTCLMIQFCTGVVYALCFSVLVVKLVVLISSKSEYGRLRGIFQLLLFLFAFVVQLVIDIEWIILWPAHSKFMNSTGEDVWSCVLVDRLSPDPNCPGVAYNSWETFFINHVLSLIYVMFLIIVCGLIALKCKNIVTNHHEALFLGLGAWLCVPAWIVWILIGALSKDITYHDPATAFGLWFTATILLLTMFLPKIRQLSKMEKKQRDVDNISLVYAKTASLKPGSVDQVDYVYARPHEFRPSSRTSSIVNGPTVRSYNVNNVTHTNRAFIEDDYTKPVPVIYEDPVIEKAESVIYESHIDNDPAVLYVRHPGSTNDLTNINSIPLTSVRRVESLGAPRYINPSRRPPSRPQSEMAYPVSATTKALHVRHPGSTRDLTRSIDRNPNPVSPGRPKQYTGTAAHYRYVHTGRRPSRPQSEMGYPISNGHYSTSYRNSLQDLSRI